MKKLICAAEIQAAASKGQRVFPVTDHTIITPAARDAARDLGVSFGSAAAADTPADGATALDAQLIYQVVKAVLTNSPLGKAAAAPYQAETAGTSGVKIVRGRTVQLERFDTGNPAAKVMYQELVGKEEAAMSAGLLTIEQSSFAWELTYEEIDIVLEGVLTLTIDGTTYQAYQGDVLFVPKGTKITWGSPDYVKLFYVTYPANWPDLLAAP